MIFQDTCLVWKLWKRLERNVRVSMFECEKRESKDLSGELSVFTAFGNYGKRVYNPFIKSLKKNNKPEIYQYMTGSHKCLHCSYFKFYYHILY